MWWGGGGAHASAAVTGSPPAESRLPCLEFMEGETLLTERTGRPIQPRPHQIKEKKKQKQTNSEINQTQKNLPDSCCAAHSPCSSCDCLPALFGPFSYWRLESNGKKRKITQLCSLFALLKYNLKLYCMAKMMQTQKKISDMLQRITFFQSCSLQKKAWGFRLSRRGQRSATDGFVQVAQVLSHQTEF